MCKDTACSESSLFDQVVCTRRITKMFLVLKDGQASSLLIKATQRSSQARGHRASDMYIVDFHWLFLSTQLGCDNANANEKHQSAKPSVLYGGTNQVQLRTRGAQDTPTLGDQQPSVETGEKTSW